MDNEKSKKMHKEALDLIYQLSTDNKISTLICFEMARLAKDKKEYNNALDIMKLLLKRQNED